MASVTNPQDLCDLLRTENACHVGFYEHCTKAADLIEAQAARIAELELERNYLSAQMDQARITIGALEAGFANDLNGDLELLLERGEPIYQIRKVSGEWVDMTEKAAIENINTGATVRVVYAHPPAAASSKG